MSRFMSSLLLAAVAAMVSTQSFASKEDDAEWVSKCVSDNKKEGQSVETVMIYCHCMNEQMPEAESQSITQWEKSHPKEDEACSKKAGWK